MNPRPRPLLVQIVSAAIFCFFFFISLRLFHGAAAADDLMESCLRRSSTCGRLENLSYPFWMDYLCGNDGFGVTDCGDPDSDPLILILGEKFRLVRAYLSAHKVTLSANEFYETACPSNPLNVSLQHRFLSYSSTNRNLFLFYNCSGAAPGVPAGNRFRCHGEEEVIYANDSGLVKYGAELAGCGRVVQVKVNGAVYGRLERKTLELDQALKLGFDVDYNFRGIFCSQCEQTFHGRCLANDSSPSFLSCQPKGSNSRINWKLKLLVGAAGTIVGLLILSILAWKMRDQARKSFGLARDPTIEAFIRNHGTLSPRRYKFSEVKRITSSFKRKLGQGGYGGVYQGKLEDGRLVAVKVLNTSKGDGQDFINEVASISRTSHVNVVSLLGFCLEGKTRALIYEFMQNGSLEKFIFKKNDLTSVEHLGWEKLYNIALGIARGLQYLHQGCNTRIVHFDIKPHNILLDENFHPKISDFGLAKLCTRNESILSMMEARGTIGYIAPEVFSRNFGVVSHKSDVYSYGMMVLEMAGGRRNLDVQVSQTSEVYFPHLVYRHLEQGTELKLQGVITSEGMEIVRKMIMVGLWCIQPCPSDRPSMSKVLEMFEGSIEALQIPPNPFLSSPPRLLQESTSTSSP